MKPATRTFWCNYCLAPVFQGEPADDPYCNANCRQKHDLEDMLAHASQPQPQTEGART